VFRQLQYLAVSVDISRPRLAAAVVPDSTVSRGFGCAGCGKTLDSDMNAARIVLGREIARVRQDRAPGGPRPTTESRWRAVPERKPVETRPLPSRQPEGQARPMTQELQVMKQGLKAHKFIRGRMSRQYATNL
jgi:hypothetical protein